MTHPKESTLLATNYYNENKNRISVETIRQLQVAREQGKKIVFVYQMGKVGSTTYIKALNNYLFLEVFHIHRLNRQCNSSMINHFLDIGQAELALEEYRWQIISEFINKHNPQIYILSAMRNPIARNMSAFFQNKSLGELKDVKNVELLIGGFLSKYPSDIPIKWFVGQFRDALGIDIFDYPFNKQRGWDIFRKNNLQCLLITAEAEDRAKTNAINAFLGTNLTAMQRENKGESKRYAKLYHEFKENIHLPTDYLDSQLNNKVIKHFYTDEQIQEFRSQWE